MSVLEILRPGRHNLLMATSPSDPGKSETWRLVDAIEELTKSGWNQEKRSQVADLIREHRFAQNAFQKERILTAIRETGNKELTEKIYMGKF